MATRLSSSAAIRSAIAVHISLTITSLAYSAFGPSLLKNDTQKHSDGIDFSSYHQCNSIDQEIMGALPWLDQLHQIISNMYTGRGARFRAMQNNVMVQTHADASLENPLVSYAGVSEIERAFRARLLLHPQNDVQTLLECIHVEASDDSISNGATTSTSLTGRQPLALGFLSPSLKGIPSPIISPPTLKVTYRLQQTYGRLFTVQSLLEVTVQVRRGKAGKVHNLTPNKLAVPLATSGCCYSRAIASQPALTNVLLNAANKKAVASRLMSRGTTHSSNNNTVNLSSSGDGHPLVAEVVRIEEMWRGVPLIHFMPFHCSRRLNGVMIGMACIIFN